MEGAGVVAAAEFGNANKPIVMATKQKSIRCRICRSRGTTWGSVPLPHVRPVERSYLTVT